MSNNSLSRGGSLRWSDTYFAATARRSRLLGTGAPAHAAVATANSSSSDGVAAGATQQAVSAASSSAASPGDGWHDVNSSGNSSQAVTTTGVHAHDGAVITAGIRGTSSSATIASAPDDHPAAQNPLIDHGALIAAANSVSTDAGVGTWVLGSPTAAASGAAATSVRWAAQSNAECRQRRHIRTSLSRCRCIEF